MRRNTTLVILVALSVFVLVVPPVRGAITQAAYLVAPSFWNVGSSTANIWNSFLTNFRDKNFLVNENAMLRGEIDRMQAQVLDRNLLAERVVTLEGTLGRAQGDDRVTATVFVNQNKSPYDILVIDAGSDNGVAQGDDVVFAGSGVIGEIAEVTSTASKVRLYSSSGVDTQAVVGSHFVPIVAAGHGMGNFEAKVPQDSIVAVGDSVVTTKGNLILGSVSLVEEKPAEPFKRIYFRTPFNITEIRSVEIIIGSSRL
ncbi:MAG: rod shape-determining protein MreC [Candidatus Paceibacterota bacterium]